MERKGRERVGVGEKINETVSFCGPGNRGWSSKTGKKI